MILRPIAIYWGDQSCKVNLTEIDEMEFHPANYAALFLLSNPGCKTDKYLMKFTTCQLKC